MRFLIQEMTETRRTFVIVARDLETARSSIQTMGMLEATVRELPWSHELQGIALYPVVDGIVEGVTFAKRI